MEEQRSLMSRKNNVGVNPDSGEIESSRCVLIQVPAFFYEYHNYINEKKIFACEMCEMFRWYNENFIISIQRM